MFLYIYLQAGLGNQLFMIFTLISYAIDNNVQYKILSKINNTMNGTKTYWDNFLIGFKNCLCENDNILYNTKLYNEPSFSYNKLPSYLKEEEYILKGFFQSYKYFQHNFDKIKNIMNFNEQKNIVLKEYGYDKTKKTIALHLRLGDYIGLQEYHYIQRPEYYICALKKMELELNNINENIFDYNIMFFCQKCDNLYADKYIKIIQGIYNNKLNFVKISNDIDDWKQLIIMSSCDHFIISNSTFSWFGCYFSENDNKIVCYPEKWFGPKNNNNNINDLCQSNWYKIIIS